MSKRDEAVPETEAKPNQKGPKQINPVVFYDRDEMPKGMKDFRPKPVSVRPTVPPPGVEVAEEAPTTEAANVEMGAMEPPPTVDPKHPSNLPAKD